ncbi:MAG: peroxiredoxin family protein [Chloroflexi bacterium]|nr:peroxiredoxin family protein [Chloroflexota bacterium]
MVQLAKVYDQVQALGADIWAISPQTIADNQNLQQRRDVPFPILADDDQAVIRAWGLFNHDDPQQRLIPYPASYVVGGNGRVHFAHLGIITRDRPTPDELIASLINLKP